jgi:hypothetical protein
MMVGSVARADGPPSEPDGTGGLQPSPYDTSDPASAPVTWGATPTTTANPTTPATNPTTPDKEAGEEVGGATVSFAVRNAAGSDIHHARVIMDGQILSGALEGWAVTIPPGEHVFEFAAAGFVSQEHTVTIHAGMVAELLTVALAPVEMPEEDLAPPFKPAPRMVDALAHDPQLIAVESKTDPWMVTYITGGTAIVALGIGTALGVSSSNQIANLKETCAPNCSESQVQSVKSDLTVADVAFVVGVVSGSVAVLWAVTHPREPAHENKTSVGFTVHGLSGQF